MRTTPRIKLSVGSRDPDWPMASRQFGRSPIKAAPDPAIPQPPLRWGASKGGDAILQNHGNRKPSGRPGGRRGSGRRRYTVTRRSDRSFLRFPGGFTGILASLSSTLLLSNFYGATVWHTDDVTVPKLIAVWAELFQQHCRFLVSWFLNQNKWKLKCSISLAFLRYFMLRLKGLWTINRRSLKSKNYVFDLFCEEWMRMFVYIVELLLRLLVKVNLD